MEVLGKIGFELPAPLIDKPLSIKNFFPQEMFDRVKKRVKETGMGPEGSLQYHTMLGRWESPISFDNDIEEYCLQQARNIFGDESLLKAYFFCARYQKINGAIPHLWEHIDQNGTQTTIDITIENTAKWDLIVEGHYFNEVENGAIAFAGQQQIHSRPFYPTMDETVFTTVLFLHFTTPDHWIQKSETSRQSFNRFSRDGDVRFLNRTGYLALPDPHIGQEICKCHDYSMTTSIFDDVYGNQYDNPPERIIGKILNEETLAPGIVKYSVDEKTTKLLWGLSQNTAWKMWEPAQVLNYDTNAPSLNKQARKCFSHFLNVNNSSCHPWDPAKRAYEGFDSTIGEAMRRYSVQYSLKPVVSDHTMLLRYEHDDFFHFHFDDCHKYPRTVSVTYFLNDDFTGGGLEFNHFGLEIKPKAGDMIIFPSAYPYMHQVQPVGLGMRFAAVKWYYWSPDAR